MTGNSRIVRDGGEITQFDNEYLPQTRSELALPLIGREQVIGMLSFQSTQAAAFEPDEVVIYESLANQISVSIENLRLITRTQETVNELQSVQRQYVHDAWAKKR